ncbi:ABC transporter substrate-binding protein [Aliihoeflea aestuarii]|jgi:microcin C transport system substrate-binding protein|uniref:extracellular solute-binding protein n=1 Tax=Aliihoeflea aestuarii TaxID=453840 RepID=UPI002092A278|nr:extracellular solute-binding protein [Aliihoeflea aestuarii]MCO6391447.1 ABC transporter substrate-binding protein [Aliihoeflea aestuarii]
MGLSWFGTIFERSLTVSALLAAGVGLAGAQGAEDTEDNWRTVSSLITTEEPTEEFTRYPHVNPDAPKGGTLNSAAFGTFDSFNPFIVRGTPAAGLSQFGGVLWDTLMQQSLDEAGTSHALIAEAFTYPDDYSSATYRIDANARWHDGEPITAEDVVWSFEKLSEISPLHVRYYANVTEAVALDDRQVRFTFDQTGNRELPHIMGDLPVLPKHWWEGENARGQTRNIANPTLEPPLGSGPYKISSFDAGSRIIWERVEDYWGADLPVNVGRNNFDRMTFTYFLDDNAEFLAFTRGGMEDIRRELSTRRWSVDYNFPAFERGDVVKREFTSESVAPMQSFSFNMREERFQDRNVRHALTLAYNFEEQNRLQFYNLNERTSSYFQRSELASSGLPEGKELEILEEYRADLPPELFTEEFKLPVFDTPQASRDNLREAVRLFDEAGWAIRDGRMVNKESGEQFRIEFLGGSPTAEVITGGYISNLRRLGIDATLRIVDTSQYIQRVQGFEFEAVTASYPQSESPGNEQRDYWSTQAADAPGSRNIPGIKSPVVDALIDKIIFAADREELVAATRALDRTLLWNYYTVPQYFQPTLRYAIWNKFGIPDEQPHYIGIDTMSWWVLPDREAEIEEQYEEAE